MTVQTNGGTSPETIEDKTRENYCMKNYVIISTYPKDGSQNIGDQLITTSLINTIRAVKGEDTKFTVIWREEIWANVEHDIRNSDAVIFACLAIRPQMHTREYPFLEEVIKCGTPYAVMSAGTALKPGQTGASMFDGFSNETIELLKKMNKKAIFFTTRGYLSQSLCEKIGLNRVLFSGDIAFCIKEYSDVKFKKERPIKNIAISDPHYSSYYYDSLRKLHRGLKDLFPNANILIAQHGVNKNVEKLSVSDGINVSPIYKNRYSGLNIYNDIDLHVGFRVHAHVSTLSRRRYSYLLEQDGRGMDYGMTINRNISVPHYIHLKRKARISALKIFSKGSLKSGGELSTDSVDQVLSIIANDNINKFDKFLGLEKQLASFTSLQLEALSKLP